jgi:ATP-dependent Lon protease
MRPLGQRRRESGLLKLICPDPDAPISNDDLVWAVSLAAEARLRVKEQQKRLEPAEFGRTDFVVEIDGETYPISLKERMNERVIGPKALSSGAVWGVSVPDGRASAGLFKIVVQAETGTGKNKLINTNLSADVLESVDIAYAYLRTNWRELWDDRNPNGRNFTTQVAPIDLQRSGRISMPVLIAICGAILRKPCLPGTVVLGDLGIDGGLERSSIPEASTILEICRSKGATRIVLPESGRANLEACREDLRAGLDIRFYTTPREAMSAAILG